MKNEFADWINSLNTDTDNMTKNIPSTIFSDILPDNSRIPCGTLSSSFTAVAMKGPIRTNPSKSNKELITKRKTIREICFGLILAIKI